MEISIAGKGRATAALVVGSREAEFDLWVAGEIQRYVRMLSGAELPIVAVGEPNPCPLTELLIGSPASNPLIGKLQEAKQVDFAGLKPDGFILKSVRHGGTTALVVGGNDDRGLMYAAYDLIERLGVTFQFTKDIIPERKSDLVLPRLDVRLEPAIKHRGFHMRHFVIPWMGYEEFCQMIDQMAKLKCNYLEFYWYEGGPWVEYSHGGEKRLIGDLYPRESGYTAWRIETYRFSTADVAVGREHFALKRPCAPEFQDCSTPEEAHRAARVLLNRMIDYAHRRKIEIWLGAGDCPTVPPNLGRAVRGAKSAGAFGYMIPPGDPAGVDIWTAILESMADTYPAADGHWLWLAETYFDMADSNTEQVLRQYDALRPLLPGKEQLLAMGYDQYLRHLDAQRIAQGDLGLLHYGKQVIERVRRSHPRARLGVSLLGRSYLFPALDTLLPKEIRLQSMEAAPCWNRSSRVPMENFGGLTGREMFLVPRLDDDENEFAMQFNAGLYEHDRVLSGSHAFGVSGIAPQVGKTRGLEQNARYIADGCWQPTLRAAEFYASYAERTFGPAARDTLAVVYRLLDENELFLGLQVDTGVAGGCLQGLGNFSNYTDSREASWLKNCRTQKDPATGMDWAKLWGADGAGEHFRKMRYRQQRFSDSIARLNRVRDLLENARLTVSPGSRTELEYVLMKTETFILHLRVCCAVMQGLLDYEAAYAAKRENRPEDMQRQFLACSGAFAEAYALAVETARRASSLIDHASERHILFRYNVRLVLPLQAFQTVVRNAVNYHQGLPYWEPVDWDLIDPA
jgi:hypothetical protein